MLIFDRVKKALRITTDEFDDYITSLIDTARADLKRAGITEAPEGDPLVDDAIVTFCCSRFGFGQSDDDERLRAIYGEKLRTMMMSSGYTDWGR